MGEDLNHAFMHPEARAAASAGVEPLDRISIRNYVTDIEIGAFQVERDVCQRIEFNLVVEVAPRADIRDDVDRILSYDRLTEAIETELSMERVNLLETLAERIAGRILAEPRAIRVFMRIEKLDRGPGALGVEIVRSRGGTHERPQANKRNRALCQTVVFLSETVPYFAGLSALLDRLEAENKRAVFCVGAEVKVAPLPEHRHLRGRIFLLAMEQAAWSFSALDTRFMVADSRTELDWGLNSGRIPVWAPSKMVLGGVAVPEVDPNDPLSLVVWFAGQMDANELMTIGVAPPVDAGIACRELIWEPKG